MDLLASLGAALMLLSALLSGMSVYQTSPGRRIDESRDRVQQVRFAAVIAACGGAVLLIWRLSA